MAFSNPAIDSSCQVDEVHPIHKIRTSEERYDPGGGGVNVARVIRELGGEAMAVYMAGGLTGQAFTHMIEAIGLQHRPGHVRRQPGRSRVRRRQSPPPDQQSSRRGVRCPRSA